MRFLQLSRGEAHLVNGPEGYAAGDLPPGTARVAVLACGVCGTDLEALRGMVLPRGVEYPLRPGHEVVGVVTERGPDDEPGPEVGDRVVLHPLAPCGECAACGRDEEQLCPRVRALGFHQAGGLAEEVVWPTRRMVPVTGLPPQQAALLADAVSTAYHALSYADLPDDGALCLLGAGGLGSQVLRLLRPLYPKVSVAAVIRSQASAERVEALGGVAVRGLNRAQEEVRAAIGRPDAVIDFTGDAAATAVGVRVLRPGGRLVLGSVVDRPPELGTTITGITAREITVRGAYVSSMAELRRVTDLARSGDLDLSDAVSHVFPLSRAGEALHLVEQHPAGLQRLVVCPEGADA